jgi:hypothetical protein
MAKEVAGFVKLQIKGGAANPAPSDRSCARFQRCEHHGILQAIQC